MYDGASERIGSCSWLGHHLLIAPKQQRACLCLECLVTLFPHFSQSKRTTAPPATTTGAVTSARHRSSRIRQFRNFTAFLTCDTYVLPYGTRISWPAKMVRSARMRIVWFRLLQKNRALLVPSNAAVLAKIPKAPSAGSITNTWPFDH